MEVIEQEKTTTVVQLPATLVEQRLQNMIDDVLAGRWCRNNYGIKATPQYGRCALGLIDQHES